MDTCKENITYILVYVALLKYGGLVWCPRQNKRIAPLPLFQEFGMDEMDCHQMAYHLSRLQYLSKLSFL
jgi:hypothetical protein